MTRHKYFFLLIALAATATVASADSFGYNVTVNTPDFGAPGWIDFSFNKSLVGTALSATATIWDFQQTGYTLDGATDFTTGVTGSLTAAPLVIPNDGGAANYFSQRILAWGSSFSFTVIFDGPAVGGSGPNGSAFRVTLFDDGFTPFVSPLPDGEVANITINPTGDFSTSGSTFSGGSATVDPVPEPASAWLLAPALGALLLLRRRIRA
ncbi:MAG: NF038129 family PEP-CTERM protein [Candidatus Solibacter sp.]|nr:NF038129 family PEP-CTERM protein [Candidatus Solibacter sp.]